MHTAEIKVWQLSDEQLQISCGSSVVQKIIVTVNSDEKSKIAAVSLVCPMSTITNVPRLDPNVEYSVAVLYILQSTPVGCVLQNITTPGHGK